MTAGTTLSKERRRILAFCRRAVGDVSIAEDITQEALLITLRRPAPSGDPASYLFGVARRLCQNHRARQQRDAARFADYDEEATTNAAPAFLRAEPDPLDSLIQAERETLIERALAGLNAPTRELLIARYINDAPLSELAARMGVSENAATVRLHRSREALKKLFSTSLRTDAAAHGLLDAETADGWRETPIICCRCGRERLLGRFEPGNPTIKDPTTNDAPHFALRCPSCYGDLIGMTSAVAPMETARVLGGVKGFRAGLNRVNRWWQEYLAEGMKRGRAPCVRCGKSAPARVGENGFGVVCDSCRDTTFFIRPTGLMYHADDFQEFWRRHPRARNRNEQFIVCEGRPAILTAFADAATSARLEMIFDRETMQRMR